MENRLSKVLESIDREFGKLVQKGARHYIEVSVGEQARKLGYEDLKEEYKDTYAVVPLKAPEKGMKVRIDGRTFLNYAEYESGIAVPGYLAKATERPYTVFVPNDSMICNFS